MRKLALAFAVLMSFPVVIGFAADQPAPAPGQAAPPSAPARGRGFWPTSTCKGCHPRTVEQHLLSHHESSFTNPVFQAQYFEEVLPRASRDPGLATEAQACTACHAPVAFALQQAYIRGAEEIDPSMSGVTCDVCHTISGWRGEAPENGNFISEPGPSKRGPFARETNWHHVYSELHTKSELCAICHEATNHHGLEVKATFTEWKKSPFAAQGVQCQDCHMTRDGFLTAGQAQYESGPAANMPGHAPVRDRLYTHRFPGAHSKSQVEGAITLAVSTIPGAPGPGDRAVVRVTVDNGRTGHKMPTGSADLRVLWLAVTARVNDVVIPLAAKSVDSSGFDVAGGTQEDARILGEDVPKGSRLYRAVFADAQGRPTLSFYDAQSIPFDNRLAAAEKRVESLDLAIPKEAKGRVQIEARLLYLPYPTALSRHWNLEKPEAVVVAAARQELTLRQP